MLDYFMIHFGPKSKSRSLFAALTWAFLITILAQISFGSSINQKSPFAIREEASFLLVGDTGFEPVTPCL
jgi:hypothetical protein